MIETEIEAKEIGNPFPGLRPFETDEYELFFGREGQSDALISRLQRSHFLTVVGTSGSGKSSLVRAGLLPALRGGMMAGEGSGWRIAVMRPGSDPIGNLALALADRQVLLEAGGGLPAAEAEAIIEATLRRGSLGLVDVVRQARLDEHAKLLVVVDQFEELFRFRAVRAASSTGDDASAFVKLLLEASQQRELSIYVVPTMRSDFLGDCAQFQGLPEAINDGQYLIPRMTRDERRFAITGPVGVTRGKITEPLVNRLMNDVGDNPDQLPILQHALMRTWEYWAGHRLNGEPIGLEHYQAVGTMTDALSKHADEAFNELPNDRSRLIAEILFKSLTERGADNREIRRPTCLKDICAIAGASAAEVSAVVEVFRRGARSFLMPPAGVALSPETVIDISHESLIRNWRRLKGWVKDEADSARTYRRLADAAMDYQAGARGLLDDVTLQFVLNWRKQLDPARAWGVRYHPEYDAAMGYLEESQVARDEHLAAERERERNDLETAHAFAEKQARSARRMRWLAAGMAVMFLVSIALAGSAFRAKKAAVRNQVKAEAATIALQRSSRQLEEKTQELEKQSRKLQTSVDNFEKAEKGRVEQTKRANESAEAAKKSEKKAQDEAAKALKQAKDADDARQLAVASEKQSKAAVERGSLLREGIEAYRHEDFKEALGSFEQLSQALMHLQPRALAGAADLRTHETTQYAEDLGWTLANLGATHRKRLDFDEAIRSYNSALVVFKQLPAAEREKPILFDTYDGLAQSHHAIARSRSRAAAKAYSVGNKSQEDLQQAEHFREAENFFKQARDFQEEHNPAQASNAHLKLARLYVDEGRFPEAEKNFEQTVELRRLGKKGRDLTNTERAELAAAFKELAEFYQGQEGSYAKTVRVLNEMIAVQEDRPVIELIGYGQEIATSYNDLAQIHAAQGDAAKREVALHDKKKAETDDEAVKKLEETASEKAKKEALLYSRKAEEALRVASLLQRNAFKLRELVKDQSPDPETQIKELTGYLDELAGGYVKLEKFPKAEEIFLEALDYRKSNKEQWKSYDKLATFYRDNKKDAAKAEEYKNRLKEAVGDNAEALKQLGALHTDDPFDARKPSEAEQYYKKSLGIYKENHDWEGENLILYRLANLYQKQKRSKEREQTRQDRINTLSAYFKQMEGKADTPTKVVFALLKQYLAAIDGLANDMENTDAANIFARALEPFDYITGKIDDKAFLRSYLFTLISYQKLLIKLQRQAEADTMGGKVKILREKVG